MATHQVSLKYQPADPGRQRRRRDPGAAQRAGVWQGQDQQGGSIDWMPASKSKTGARGCDNYVDDLHALA
jgi:hypothetical protein